MNGPLNPKLMQNINEHILKINKDNYFSLWQFENIDIEIECHTLKIDTWGGPSPPPLIATLQGTEPLGVPNSYQ